jgi:hypothetical protein
VFWFFRDLNIGDHGVVHIFHHRVSRHPDQTGCKPYPQVAPAELEL